MDGNDGQDSSKKLSKEYIFHIKKMNYRKASEILERMMKVSESAKEDLYVAKLLFDVGNGLAWQGYCYEAEENLERALEIQLKKLGENHDDTANTYEAIGETLLRQDVNHQKAEAMYRKALDIKREILPKKEVADLIDLYQQLALSLQKQRKFSEATKIQKFVLATLLDLHGEDHPAIVKTYIAIAGRLRDEDRPDDALQMSDKCIDICSRLQQQEEFDVKVLAMSLLVKSKCLFDLQNFEGVTELLTQLLVIEESLGEMDPSTAETYENLAVTYIRRGMIKDSIKAYTKAIHIFKTVLGDDHPDTKKYMSFVQLLEREKVAKALHEEGLAIKEHGDLKKALQLFQEALGIYTELYAAQAHPSFNALAESISALHADMIPILEMQGKLSQIAKMKKQMLANLLLIYDENHPRVQKEYMGMAGLKTDQKGFKDARLAEALLNKAKSLEALGNSEGATELFAQLETLMVDKETLGERHPSTAEAYEKLALTYARRDLTGAAIQAYTKAIKIRKAVFGNDHPRTKELMIFLKVLKREKSAKALHKKGLAMKQKGDLENALDLIQEALSIYNQIYSSQIHPSLETFSENISAIYYDMAEVFEMFSDANVEKGLLELGIASSLEALKLRRNAFGDDHPETKKRMEAHRSLLHRLLENRT
ncbi:unnamed protein product [Cylindrotheca closterium]|uniref:Kinesin light chain n=1 Tax=Cylindrotheca closterium TaxID=2856 RepID=A0AAD2JJX6_9STRA|nr:unnamed protein product [Cylindrotheca closterium]